MRQRIGDVLRATALLIDGRGYVPAPIEVYIDVRQLSHALLRYQLSRASRGPVTLNGGSLITGQPEDMP